MRHLALIALLFGPPLLAHAQTPYFPLDVGNRWTLFEILDPPFQPADTIMKTPFSVFETVEVGGQAYVSFGKRAEEAQLLRVDEAGRVYQHIDGQDVLWLDFGRADGETYAYTPPVDFLNQTVTVTWGKPAETHAGRFEDTITFEFDDPMTLDDEIGYTFAREVGLVLRFGAWYNYERLFSAEIGGVTIAEVVPERGEVGEDFALDPVYPNPFNATAMISFRLAAPASVTITVSDLLGRRVVMLLDGMVRAGTHTVRWAADGHPGGLYLVRLQNGAQAHTQAVALLR